MNDKINIMLIIALVMPIRLMTDSHLLLKQHKILTQKRMKLIKNKHNPINKIISLIMNVA